MGGAPCPVTATGCVPRDRQGAQAAGFAACPGKGPNFPERSMPIDEPRLNAFLGRALNDMGAAMSATLILIGDQIGRAPCRERVCKYVEISVVAVAVKKK